MIRRPPGSTRKETSAASDVYKRLVLNKSVIFVSSVKSRINIISL
ncbi:hypothetical protein [Staphylococcus aureus]